MDSLNIDEEKQIILQNFRNRLSDLLEPRHDDRFLLRWLRARDFDLQQAEKMLREDFKCRKKMKSDFILKENPIPEEITPFIPTAFLGYSYGGHPVRIFNIGHSDIKGLTRALTVNDLLKLVTYICEEDAKMLREQNEKTGSNVETSVYIVDYSKLRLSRWCDTTVIRYGIYVARFYQDHYPETMHRTIAINVPKFIVHFFNNIIKPFLAETVIRKISIYREGDDSYKDDIFSIVPREIFPACYGGDRYGPDGDPMCHGLLLWHDLIPTSLYKKEQLTLNMKDSQVQQTLIHERSTFDVQLKVDVPGVVLSWQFQTKDRNIKFGLFFSCKSADERSAKSKKKDDELEVLLPVESTESHILVENGEHECEKPGTYILHFDNTFSWLRSKHLLYKVELRKPKYDEEPSIKL